MNNIKKLIEEINLRQPKNYEEMKLDWKNTFFSKYLKYSINEKGYKSGSLAEYFDKYQTFCFDLRSDSVLKGDLNFNYK